MTSTLTTVLIDLALVGVCAASVAVVVFLRMIAVKLIPTRAEPEGDRAVQADAALEDPGGIPLWSDDVLAEQERATRPETVGADPWYVDTFELEQGEREHRDEALLRAALGARPAPP